MLQLNNITKVYKTGELTQRALDGVSLSFRENEFVSILGQSGSGKTTMLNIIGGLDRYDSGDLVINGRSTKQYRDRDWDTYRNHSVGFVFQSYNLIPHQTVLSNVELALTLSGVSKKERKRRATDALRAVGLGDQLHKRPSQMSGGQMQRVAIARALVNDPDILLADEPTGALDSETSVQIMELLKEVAKDRLIIMVTHNPELADKYSTRIIRLSDGHIIGDSDPFEPEAAETAENADAPKDAKKSKSVGVIESADGPTVVIKKTDEKTGKGKKTSMSFFTALSLSLNNLMTKKGRTFMTSFAGSIGIIGIALILSLSNGVQAYIDSVQQDTLTSYPITIAAKSVDITSMMTAMADAAAGEDKSQRDENLIYSRDQMYSMLDLMTSQVKTNNLAEFKKYIEESAANAAEGEKTISSLSSAISYSYDIEMTLYNPDTENGVLQVNPGTVFERIGMTGEGGASNPMMAMAMNTDVWHELIDNNELIHSQYEVLAGNWPENYNEVVLMVSEDNEVSDYTLYTLGLKDADELKDMMDSLMTGKSTEDEAESKSAESYTYDELLALSYKLVPAVDTYESRDGMWIDKSDDEEYMKQIIADAPEIKIVGIVRADSTSASSSEAGGIGYTAALTEYMIQRVNGSEIVKAQKDAPDTDVFTGKPFSTDDALDNFDINTLPPEQQAYLSGLSDEARREVIASYVGASAATYEGNLEKLQSVDTEDPAGINIYPADFESKEAICDLIADYNQKYTDEGKDEYVINYSDVVGLMMSSVTTIINAISYVLIAFVSISLVVSSIMIGIITYISVLERTKEIGILRSIGASKKDISRVFNAETLIVGFVSGLIGIGVTVLLCIPASMIIEHFTGIGGLAKLPPIAGVILVLISMMLTLIAGLFPSGVAARKDPVEALRSE